LEIEIDIQLSAVKLNSGLHICSPQSSTRQSMRHFGPRQTHSTDSHPNRTRDGVGDPRQRAGIQGPPKMYRQTVEIERDHRAPEPGAIPDTAFAQDLGSAKEEFFRFTSENEGLGPLSERRALAGGYGPFHGSAARHGRGNPALIVTDRRKTFQVTGNRSV